MSLDLPNLKDKFWLERFFTTKLKEDLHVKVLEESRDQIHLSKWRDKWKESNNSEVSLLLRFWLKWKFHEILLYFLTKEEITLLCNEERRKRHGKK